MSMNYSMCPLPSSGGTSGYSSTTEGSANTARVGGNNPYGSLGTWKCTTCRDRRKRCEFTDWNQPCAYCALHNVVNCVKVQAPLQQRDNQDSTPSPLPSTTAQSSSKVSDMAKMYENAYPGATPQQIVQYLIAAFSGSQQQQSQPAQVQNQYQAQPLPTQQTQSTQGYYPYGNQSYPSYGYNSGTYDTQPYNEMCLPEPMYSGE